MKGKERRPKKFLVELIKPSHYEDQAYVIQWWRGFIPSNSLSCLYGLALDVSQRRVLGPGTDIRAGAGALSEGRADVVRHQSIRLRACVTAYPRMTAKQWRDIYRRAWHLYYTREHVETILRRAAATGLNLGRVASMIFYFYASHAFEGVHPLQSGVFRRKRRSQRKGGFPRESALVFYPRRLIEVIGTYVPALWYLAKLELLRWRIRRDPERRQYTDVPILPAAQDDKSLFNLYRREPSRIFA